MRRTCSGFENSKEIPRVQFLQSKDRFFGSDAADVQQRQAAGEQLFILDVREPAEYAEAHIAGSMLIPLSQLANRLGKLPHDRPIIAVCRSGNRSSAALSVLTHAGFTNALNLRGGMLAWARSGLPIKRGK